MLKKSYTILVFNEIFGKPFKIRIPASLLKYSLVFAFISFATFIGFTSYFINLYHINNKDAREVNTLRAESRSQRLQIEKFIKQINGFEKDIKRIEKLDKKLRVISRINSVEEAVPGIRGTGGSSEISMNELNLSSHANPIEKLSLKLGQLKERANLREVSLYQIDQYFKDRKSFLSSVPSIWPVRGWVTSGFGYRVSPYTGLKEMHEGIDIATRLHSNIISPADGIVISSERRRAHGLMMEIDHGYGFLTRYAHNSKNTVKIGDRVKRGDIIAQTGNTGRSTGPHLHYALFLNGIPVNPPKYIVE